VSSCLPFFNIVAYKLPGKRCDEVVVVEEETEEEGHFWLLASLTLPWLFVLFDIYVFIRADSNI